jgi:hypothetical protein
MFHRLLYGFLQPVQELTEYTYFICCTLFCLDMINLLIMPMSLFLDNCVLCFQCTSLLRAFRSYKRQKKRDLILLDHFRDQARDQNPLLIHLSSVCQSLIPSEKGLRRTIAPNGNTNLRLFCIPTKWFF